MDRILVQKTNPNLHGTIALEGSKSISNRALIALALAGVDPAQYLTHLASARDTRTLLQLLQQDSSANSTYDAGDAGTTFRFLTAYLALQPGEKTLTGSPRMKERPVGPLVNALQALGANISFLEKEGYPPLKIGPWEKHAITRPQIRIKADTSSQFLSALLLIAPHLPQGLELIPEGYLVSKPYIDMTIRLMRHFGATVTWNGDSISVEPGHYQPRPLQVEADWSAASYWFAMAALAKEVNLRLEGLFQDSWQGDAVLVNMSAQLGLLTTFDGNSVQIQKSSTPPRQLFEWNFVECPDIAQTLAVCCAGLGIQGLFSGLETLFIKETDRVAALKTELTKVGVSFSKLPPHFSKKNPGQRYYMCSGKAQWTQTPAFSTYEDHRMALSFAPFSLLGPVYIEHPGVVAKSYPGFWKDLEALGWEVLHEYSH